LKYPNEETQKVIKEARKGRNLIKLDTEEFLKRNYKTLMSKETYETFKETIDNIVEDL
jgi:hypothetical protein